MKNRLKKILLIATLCTHHQATFSVAHPHENVDAITCIALLAAAIVAGSLYDVGKIYCKKYLLKPLGIQTEANTQPLLFMLPENKKTPPVNTHDFATTQDFREKKADKKKIMISNNGTITTPAQYANDQLLSSTRWNGTASPDSIKKLQSRYLNEGGSVIELPRVPEKFDVNNASTNH